MTCQINSCKKKIPYAIGPPVFTSPSCCTCQKVKGVKKVATAQFFVQVVSSL